MGTATNKYAHNSGIKAEAGKKSRGLMLQFQIAWGKEANKCLDEVYTGQVKAYGRRNRMTLDLT